MNRISNPLLFLCICISFIATAQSDSTSRFHITGERFDFHHTKGSFYFAWGYNKNWYSTSDVRVHDKSGDYDFTIYDLKAHDRTHFDELFVVQPSIPQYGYRLGYWMPNQKFGVEIKFDHAKYIVYDNQTARLTGKINGEFYDTDTLITPEFLHLEHTDGANFLMFNVMYRKDLVRSRFVRISGVVKFGAGIVVPRTDVTLFGQRWNHCFHVAGQIAGAECGIRSEFFRYLFVELSAKGVFANFNKVLAVDDVLISHHFWDGMLLFDAGFQFPMGHARSKK